MAGIIQGLAYRANRGLSDGQDTFVHLLGPDALR